METRRKSPFMRVLAGVLSVALTAIGSPTAESSEEHHHHHQHIHEAAAETVDTAVLEEETDIIMDEPAALTYDAVSNLYYNEAGEVVEVEEELIPYQTYIPANYPSKYSMVDQGVMTPVRNQGGTQTCWAHALLAAAETNMIIQGINDAATDINLSEAQLAWFLTKPSMNASDPMYLDAKPTNSNISSPYGYAASSYEGISLLARGTGVINESVTGAITSRPTLNESMRYQSDAMLVGASQFDPTDFNSIKQHLMTKGAVTLCYNSNDENLTKENSAYYQPDYRKYSTNGGTDGLPVAEGHAITIVGWDDNYSKDNFTSGDNGEGPSKNGAWLCKNSWGEVSPRTDDGYNWISYYDAGLNSFFGLEMAEKGTYDHIYQYDGMWSGSWPLTSPVSLANVFTAQKNETIASVGIRVADAMTDYTVAVYKDVKDGTPSSGTKLTEQTGTFAYAGYHLVEFTEPVFLEKGDKFSIVVMLEREGSVIRVPCTGTHVNTSKISYYKYSGSSAWKDCSSATYPFDPPIKAYTQYAVPLTAQVFPDAIFRDHLAENYDLDADGMLSETEIASITELDVEDLGIKDMCGIEHLTQLQYLYCGGNALTHLNLDYNTKLIYVSGNNTRSYTSFVCTSPLLPEGMDINRITNLTGAKKVDGKLVPLQQSIQYSYQCSNSFKINVVLMANSFEHNTLGIWTDAGSYHKRSCSGCKEVLKGDHITGAWTKYSNTYHSQRCLYCDYVVYDEHEVGDWEKYTTTLHRRTCSTCSYYETELHNFTNWESIGNNQMERYCVECGFTATMDGLIISDTLFPDAVFRKYVKTNIDTDGDGILFDTELESVIELHLDEMGISDLTGIACFYNLQELSCIGNTITSLDLSGNPALQVLVCSENQMETLNLTGCSSLMQLTCENNLIERLDLVDCTSLSYFDGDQNPLVALELHSEVPMRYFSCENCVREVGRVTCNDVTSWFTEFNRISDEQGFIVNGSHIIPLASQLTYVYDCGNGCTATFTINATAISHMYGAWSDFSDDGHIKTCRYCGFGIVEKHMYGSWTDNEDGTHTQTCLHCTNAVTASHNYSNWTDNEDGTHRMTCEDCQAQLTEEHIFTDWTADADGTHSRTCEICLAKESQNHVFQGWLDQSATSHGRTCVICKETETQSHTFTAWTDSGKNYHQRTCTGCGRNEYDNHTCAGWTDNGDGTWTQSCTSCDFSETSEHQFGAWRYESSTSHYRICEICDEVESEPHNDTDYVNNGDGTHENACPTCGLSRRGSHIFDIVDNGDGTHTKTCRECDEVLTEGHHYGNWFSPAETVEHYAFCIECMNLYSEPHSFDSSTDNGDGTHTQQCSICEIAQTNEHTLQYTNNGDGSHTANCLYCDFTEEEFHEYSAWTEDSEGQHTHSCLYCDEAESEAHTFGRYIANADGTHTRICSVCMLSEKSEHVFDEVVSYDAEGHSYECVYCQTTEVFAHNYSSTVIGEDNGHQYTCEDCDYIKIEEHIFEEWINVGDGTHRSICVACAEPTIAEHEYGEWTDDGKGWHEHVCFCGAKESSGHKILVWTETADGQHYGLCSLCDGVIKGEHQYGNWTEDGNGNHVKTCSVCKKAVPEEHPLTYVDNGDGTHTYHCEICDIGETVEHEFGDWTDDGTGFHTHTCACGKSESTGHKYGVWLEINGQHSNTCTVCGAEALGDHVYGSWANDKNGNHFRSCIICRKKQTEPHVYTYVDNNDGTHSYSCTCGLKATEEHQFGEWTDEGNNFHFRVCPCGKKESTGHVVGEWECTETSHSNSCTLCGAEISGAHAFGDWAKNRSGYYERTCLNCKYTESQRAGDMDKDQTWTAFDLAILKLLCQNMDEKERPITADFNLDRKVNIEDIKALQAYLLARKT